MEDGSPLIHLIVHSLHQIFNAFNELKNNVNQKETLNLKHCNEIKGEVARVTRSLAEVTKQQQQQQQGAAGNSVTPTSPMLGTKAHDKSLAKITATVEDIKKIAHSDAKTLSAMNTIIQGLKSNMAAHEGKVSSQVSGMVKEQDAKVLRTIRHG